jgi:hypothetical protein
VILDKPGSLAPVFLISAERFSSLLSACGAGGGWLTSVDAISSLLLFTADFLPVKFSWVRNGSKSTVAKRMTRPSKMQKKVTSIFIWDTEMMFNGEAVETGFLPFVYWKFKELATWHRDHRQQHVVDDTTDATTGEVVTGKELPCDF